MSFRPSNVTPNKEVMIDSEQNVYLATYLLTTKLHYFLMARGQLLI